MVGCFSGRSDVLDAILPAVLARFYCVYLAYERWGIACGHGEMMIAMVRNRVEGSLRWEIA